VNGTRIAKMLIAGMLIAGTALAQGQEAPAPSQSPPSQSPPPAPAPSSSTSSSASDSKSEPVCFKLTGHCVDASKAPSGAKTGTAAAKADAQANGQANSKRKKLNLAAPDVRTVVPEQELKEPLPSDNQITEVQESQTVSVKTDEGVPPEVPMGLGAVWWAVVHPSQAWRILTPE